MNKMIQRIASIYMFRQISCLKIRGSTRLEQIRPRIKWTENWRVRSGLKNIAKKETILRA